MYIKTFFRINFITYTWIQKDKEDSQVIYIYNKHIRYSYVIKDAKNVFFDHMKVVKWVWMPKWKIRFDKFELLLLVKIRMYEYLKEQREAFKE